MLDQELAAFFADRPADAKPSLERPNIGTMPETEATVAELMRRGRYRDALRVTRLLTDTTSPRQIDSKQRLLAHSAAAYMRLNEFKNAQTLLKRGGSTVWSPSEPFNLQLMRCELPHYLGHPEETERLLSSLLDRVESERADRKDPAAQARRVRAKMISYLVVRQKHPAAIQLIDAALGETPGDADLLSRKIKILLKMGDVKGAAAATDALGKSIGMTDPRSREARAYLLISESKFADAMALLEIDNKPGSPSASPEAINNYCVCALFLNKIDVAISTLEACVRANPFRALTRTVVQNLCAVYELCSMPTRKRLLGRIVEAFAADDVIEATKAVF